MSKKRYYLAYGSNLNRKQMQMRCPGAKVVGTALLEGYELLFKGSKTGFYLTIEPKADGVVPVAVWEVTADHEKMLDRYEGCPVCYYKKEISLPVRRAKAEERCRRTALCTSCRKSAGSANRHRDISGPACSATVHSDSIPNSSTKPTSAAQGICTDKKAADWQGSVPCPTTVDYIYVPGAPENERSYSIVSEYNIHFQEYQDCNIHNHSAHKKRIVLYI